MCVCVCEGVDIGDGRKGVGSKRVVSFRVCMVEEEFRE